MYTLISNLWKDITSCTEILLRSDTATDSSLIRRQDLVMHACKHTKHVEIEMIYPLPRQHQSAVHRDRTFKKESLFLSQIGTVGKTLPKCRANWTVEETTWDNTLLLSMSFSTKQPILTIHPTAHALLITTHAITDWLQDRPHVLITLVLIRWISRRHLPAVRQNRLEGTSKQPIEP